MEDNNKGDIPKIYYLWYAMSNKKPREQQNPVKEDPPPPLKAQSYPVDHDFFDGLAKIVKK